jgi:hypothetical protein
MCISIKKGRKKKKSMDLWMRFMSYNIALDNDRNDRNDTNDVNEENMMTVNESTNVFMFDLRQRKPVDFSNSVIKKNHLSIMPFFL